MKVKASLIDMMEAIRELSNKRTHIQDMQMGQRTGYAELQAAMNAEQQQKLYAQYSLAQQQSSGLLGQLDALGLSNANQYLSNPTPEPNLHSHKYPGLRDAFGYFGKEVDEIAKSLGFKYSYDTDCFKHKETNGFVSRRMIEDSRYPLKELFIRARTPNITWLDDRVNEMRVKLI